MFVAPLRSMLIAANLAPTPLSALSLSVKSCRSEVFLGANESGSGRLQNKMTRQLVEELYDVLGFHLHTKIYDLKGKFRVLIRSLAESKEYQVKLQ